MKYFLLGMFMSCLMVAHSQQLTPDAIETENTYLKVAKKQQKTAWVLFGSGLTVATAGGLIALNNTLWEFRGPYSGTEENFNAGVVVLIVGAAMAAGSIPLFIIASGNRSKGQEHAAQLKFKLEKCDLNRKVISTNRSYPALSFQIKF